MVSLIFGDRACQLRSKVGLLDEKSSMPGTTYQASDYAPRAGEVCYQQQGFYQSHQPAYPSNQQQQPAYTASFRTKLIIGKWVCALYFHGR
ncbi:hypothetical protein Y032_0049g1813 [Ancylostoma ceylanicum]|uniref:Uncharacterized protein n=1 Tax=Ancylostoma ceylanicum TaxID=53326 RepID=A0A016UAH4_9BILA|nr:hypothetical protein Y032_0049g1813 [Ancylostoma ceylanicum]